MLFLFIPLTISENITYYISNSGSMSNNGTIDFPFAPDYIALARKLQSLPQMDVTYIFLEGEYYIGGAYGFSLNYKYTGSVYNSVTFKGEEGKTVYFNGGIAIKNWEKSKFYPHLWTTQLDTQISTLFVNDRRKKVAQVPNEYQKVRTLYYSSYLDPDHEGYTCRQFWVQSDVIEILKDLPTDELQKVQIVDIHGGRYIRENLYKIDITNNIIVSHVKTEDIKTTGIYHANTGDMYFLENLFPALNMPGEWYQFPNNTLFYYPEVDDDINNPQAYYPKQGLGFHGETISNFTLENVVIQYMGSVGLYYTKGSKNIILRNIVVRHCYSGVTLSVVNALVEHVFIEDVASRGGMLHSCRNLTIYNNIIRVMSRIEFNTPGFFIQNCRDLVIKNNDISGCYAAGALINGRESSCNLVDISNITFKDNHIHNIGFRLLDDFGGIQGLAVPIGVIADHNWIHDVYHAAHIGNGLFFGTNAAGVIMKNNLVHDVSGSGLKMDIGCNITLHNNILAYAGYSVTWTTYIQNTFTFHIDNNIIIHPSAYIYSGPWTDNFDHFYMDKNIYYDTPYSDTVWDQKSFQSWQQAGKDINSFNEDPLFYDPDNRNFSFKANTAYKKIGFNKFDLTFGVVDTNNDGWRKKAEYVHEAPYPVPLNYQLYGQYGFEDDEDKCLMKQHISFLDAEITSSKKSSGSKSLLFPSTNGEYLSKNIPTLTIPLNWYQGFGSISFKLFMEEDTIFGFDMNFGRAAMKFQNGKIYNYKVVSGKTYEVLIGEFPQNLYNKWTTLQFSVGCGDSKTGNFSMKMDDIEYSDIEITSSKYSSSSQAVLYVYQSTTPTYVDDIDVIFDNSYKNFFHQELLSKNRPLNYTIEIKEDTTLDINNPLYIYDHEIILASSATLTIKNVNTIDESDDTHIKVGFLSILINSNTGSIILVPKSTSISVIAGKKDLPFSLSLSSSKTYTITLANIINAGTSPTITVTDSSTIKLVNYPKGKIKGNSLTITGGITIYCIESIEGTTCNSKCGLKTGEYTSQTTTSGTTYSTGDLIYVSKEYTFTKEPENGVSIVVYDNVISSVIFSNAHKIIIAESGSISLTGISYLQERDNLLYTAKDSSKLTIDNNGKLSIITTGILSLDQETITSNVDITISTDSQLKLNYISQINENNNIITIDNPKINIISNLGSLVINSFINNLEIDSKIFTSSIIFTIEEDKVLILKNVESMTTDGSNNNILVGNLIINNNNNGLLNVSITKSISIDTNAFNSNVEIIVNSGITLTLLNVELIDENDGETIRIGKLRILNKGSLLISPSSTNKLSVIAGDVDLPINLALALNINIEITLENPLFSKTSPSITINGNSNKITLNKYPKIKVSGNGCTIEGGVTFYCIAKTESKCQSNAGLQTGTYILQSAVSQDFDYSTGDLLFFPEKYSLKVDPVGTVLFIYNTVTAVSTIFGTKHSILIANSSYSKLSLSDVTNFTESDGIITVNNLLNVKNNKNFYIEIGNKLAIDSLEITSTVYVTVPSTSSLIVQNVNQLDESDGKTIRIRTLIITNNGELNTYMSSTLTVIAGPVDMPFRCPHQKKIYLILSNPIYSVTAPTIYSQGQKTDFGLNNYPICKVITDSQLFGGITIYCIEQTKLSTCVSDFNLTESIYTSQTNFGSDNFYSKGDIIYVTKSVELNSDPGQNVLLFVSSSLLISSSASIKQPHSIIMSEKGSVTIKDVETVEETIQTEPIIVDSLLSILNVKNGENLIIVPKSQLTITAGKAGLPFQIQLNQDLLLVLDDPGNAKYSPIITIKSSESNSLIINDYPITNLILDSSIKILNSVYIFCGIEVEEEEDYEDYCPTLTTNFGNIDVIRFSGIPTSIPTDSILLIYLDSFSDTITLDINKLDNQKIIIHQQSSDSAHLLNEIPYLRITSTNLLVSKNGKIYLEGNDGRATFPDGSSQYLIVSYDNSITIKQENCNLINKIFLEPTSETSTIYIDQNVNLKLQNFELLTDSLRNASITVYYGDEIATKELILDFIEDDNNVIQYKSETTTKGKGGLSNGAIAGIVIGSVIFGVLIAIGVIIIIRKRKGDNNKKENVIVQL